MTREEYLAKWYKHGQDVHIQYGVVTEADERYFLQQGQLIVVEYVNDNHPIMPGIQSKPGKLNAKVEYFDSIYDAIDFCAEFNRLEPWEPEKETA